MVKLVPVWSSRLMRIRLVRVEWGEMQSRGCTILLLKRLESVL
jgi:hypothetical protein